MIVAEPGPVSCLVGFLLSNGGGDTPTTAAETATNAGKDPVVSEKALASAQVLQPLFHLDPACLPGTTELTIWPVDSQEGQQVADPVSHAPMPHRNRASVCDLAHVSTCRDHIAQSVKERSRPLHQLWCFKMRD